MVKVLSACAPCAQYIRGGPPRQARLKPLVTGAPWERISIDITGPHPRSSKGYEYILTVIDHFTKWAEAFPLYDHTAPSVARRLVTEVFVRFGCPNQILSDQGPEFDSILMAKICKELRIDKVRTSPYKASTNGAVERFHRTLNAMLGKVVSDNQRDWHEWLPLVVSAYRASPHAATKFSPNMLVFGRETRMPIDVVLGRPQEDQPEERSYEDFADGLVNRLEAAYDVARRNLQTAALRRKNTYDLRVHEKAFSRGSWVWYYCPRRFRGRSPKWQRLYSGPFLVTKIIPPVNCVIQLTKHSQPKVVHIDKLKAWNGDPLVSWLDLHEEPEAELSEHEGAAPEPTAQVDHTVSEAVESDESYQGRVVAPARPVRERRPPRRLAEYVV